MKLFDSHCHLNFPAFDLDRSQVIENCINNGVTSICIPAIQSTDWLPLIELQQPLMRQYVALGLHPCFTSKHQMEDIEILDELLAKRPSTVVAVGETGLDFYDRQLSDSARKFQVALFTKQVQLARKHALPLIIHARKSHDYILKVLRQHQPEAGGIIHAFSGSEQQAKQYIDLGFKLGFGGGITYLRAKKTRHLATALSLQNIVLETDAPDMPICGFQGQRNSPARLPLIAQCLADLRGVSVAEVIEITTLNCLQLLNQKSIHR